MLKISPAKSEVRNKELLEVPQTKFHINLDKVLANTSNISEAVSSTKPKKGETKKQRIQRRLEENKKQQLDLSSTFNEIMSNYGNTSKIKQIIKKANPVQKTVRKL